MSSGSKRPCLPIKEDRAEVTLGNLIKIPPNLLLDLSPMTFGRIKMFLKFIFLCLQNMVSGHNAIKKARVDKMKLHVPFLSTFDYFRSWPMSNSWGWLGRGRLMYSTCWPETMFWRQRKMNFENIFILPNVLGYFYQNSQSDLRMVSLIGHSLQPLDHSSNKLH